MKEDTLVTVYYTVKNFILEYQGKLLIGVAAVAGKIDTLIIEADRMIPNKLTNLITGNIQNRDLTNPKVDDLLDDLGELVLKMGGQVMVLPAEKMPSETGLAAIFRY